MSNTVIDTSRRGFLGGVAATLLVTSIGVKLGVPQTKPLLAANGWPICNGQRLLRSDYPDLFKVIGTYYRGVDPIDDNVGFLLPNFGGVECRKLMLVHALCPKSESNYPAGMIAAFVTGPSA